MQTSQYYYVYESCIFAKLFAKGIDTGLGTCYTESMNKNNKLTPGNIKYVAMPQDLHAILKARAKAQHSTIYEVIFDLVDKAQRYEAASAALKEIDHATD